MEKELEQALTKVADRLESLEDFSVKAEGRIAKLEEGATLMQPSGESSASEAQLKERITSLESRKIRDYPAAEQGAYLMETLNEMGPETVAVLLVKSGKASMLREATEAEVAEAEVAEAEKHEEGSTGDEEAQVNEDPEVIEGQTDKPGYRYLQMLNVSIKDKGEG